MVAVVDALEANGYAERRRDETDRRAYALRATPAGRRVLRRAERAVERAEARFLDGLGPDERRHLKDQLRALASR
jgi:DNA-binding MarR family transcriptional regulator